MTVPTAASGTPTSDWRKSAGMNTMAGKIDIITGMSVRL